MMVKPTNFYRPLAIVILFELFMLVAIQAWEFLSPAVPLRFMLVICPLVCLEGLYSGSLIRIQKLHSYEIPRFRAFELGGLAIIIKLAAAASSGNFTAHLLTLDLATGVAAVFSLIVWLAALSTADDFRHLDEPPPAIYQPQQGYTPPLALLTTRYFTAGILMFAAMGLLSLARLSISALVAPVFAYFVIGLLWFPDLNYRMTRHHWQSLGIGATDGVAVPWVRAGLILAAIAIVFAILLPTGYLNGLLDFFRALFAILIGIISFLVTLAAWLIMLPVRLLTGTLDEPDNAPPKMPQMPQMPDATTSSGPALDVLFKIGLVVVLAYIIISYLRDHPELWALLKKFRLIQALSSLWAALRSGFVRLAGDIRIRLPDSLPAFFRRGGQSGNPFRFIRLNALSPRERVMFYYLSMVRRAGEHGVPRAPSETPREYGGTLKPVLPEAQDEVDRLSDSFTEARYSRHPVEADAAESASASWQRLRAAIRKLNAATNTNKK